MGMVGIGMGGHLGCLFCGRYNDQSFSRKITKENLELDGSRH